LDNDNQYLSKKVTHLHEILKVIRSNTDLFNNKYKEREPLIQFAYLGGSVAKSQNTSWSDLDIFICINPIIYEKLSTKEKTDLILNLAVDLEDLGLKNVEVSIFQDIPETMQFRVFRDGYVVFDRDSRSRTSFIEQLLVTVYDLIIWQENYINLAI
jgi:adenylate cyclase